MDNWEHPYTLHTNNNHSNKFILVKFELREKRQTCDVFKADYYTISKLGGLYYGWAIRLPQDTYTFYQITNPGNADRVALRVIEKRLDEL